MAYKIKDQDDSKDSFKDNFKEMTIKKDIKLSQDEQASVFNDCKTAKEILDKLGMFDTIEDAYKDTKKLAVELQQVHATGIFAPNAMGAFVRALDKSGSIKKVTVISQLAIFWHYVVVRHDDEDIADENVYEILNHIYGHIQEKIEYLTKNEDSLTAACLITYTLIDEVLDHLETKDGTIH